MKTSLTNVSALPEVTQPKYKDTLLVHSVISVVLLYNTRKESIHYNNLKLRVKNPIELVLTL